MRTPVITVLAAAAVLGLTACGGSGGGSSTSATPSATATSATAASTSPASTASSAAGETASTSPSASDEAAAASAGSGKAYTYESLAKALAAGGVATSSASSVQAVGSKMNERAQLVGTVSASPAGCTEPVRALLTTSMKHVALAHGAAKVDGSMLGVLTRSSAQEAKGAIDAILGMSKCPDVMVTEGKGSAPLKGSAKPWKVDGADDGVLYTGSLTEKGKSSPFSFAFARVGNAIIGLGGDDAPSAAAEALARKAVAALKADQAK